MSLDIWLSIIVNLITIAVVNGFQNEVRQKITGFGFFFTLEGKKKKHWSIVNAFLIIQSTTYWKPTSTNISNEL